MKKIIASVIAVALTVFGLCGVATMSPAYATAGTEYLENVKPEGSAGNDLMATVKVAIGVVLGVVGLLAVVMIIIGGINFITSQGEAAKVTKARNTILYGVIGLVIALLAYAIVFWVLGALFE